MKRAAAIIGPTPSFVRWAIRFECPYRQPVEKDLPYHTFRQLRTIRELSVARLRGHLVEGFCIHPEFNQDVETARGFPESEVYEIFGEPGEIHSACNACPANANSDFWAGCYGWFFSAAENVNWIERFQAATELDLPLLPESKRVWFRVWQRHEWHGPALQCLDDLLMAIPEVDVWTEMRFFQQAVKACTENELVLETELVPTGMSDGLNWTIEPCCSICRCELPGNSRACEECGHRGSPVPQQKKKVLGLRPYMRLTDLIGPDETQRLLDGYHLKQRQREKISGKSTRD